MKQADNSGLGHPIVFKILFLIILMLAVPASPGYSEEESEEYPRAVTLTGFMGLTNLHTSPYSSMGQPLTFGADVVWYPNIYLPGLLLGGHYGTEKFEVTNVFERQSTFSMGIFGLEWPWPLSERLSISGAFGGAFTHIEVRDELTNTSGEKTVSKESAEDYGPWLGGRLTYEVYPSIRLGVYYSYTWSTVSLFGSSWDMNPHQGGLVLSKTW